jgi:hypothetical protein
MSIDEYRSFPFEATPTVIDSGTALISTRLAPSNLAPGTTKKSILVTPLEFVGFQFNQENNKIPFPNQ